MLILVFNESVRIIVCDGIPCIALRELSILKTTFLVCRRVMYICTNVSEELAACVFRKGERRNAKIVHVRGREARP